MKLLLAFLFIFSSFHAFAEIKQEVTILNKCYSQLVNKRISPDHRLVQAVIKKEITGSQGCYQLVDEIEFDSKGLLTPKTKESVEILRTFQKIHDSWFPRFNFNISTQDFPNTDFYDANEMGYHFTWVLFKDEKLKNALTKKRSFKGIRESEKDHLYFIDRRIRGHRQLRKNHHTHKWKIGGSEEEDGDDYQGPVSYWDPELIEFGKLIGLSPFSKTDNKIQRWLGGKKIVEYDTLAPKGGGVIGSVPYLLLNTEHIDQRNDGGNKLHRRWATSITSDLLCRNLPILNQNEVSSFIKKKSKIGFRKKADCMNCHSTIDSMAAVIRNLENYNSGDVDIHYTIRNIFMHQPNRVHTGDLPDSMESFFQTRPEGRFIHKDIYGKRLNQKVSNLNELGQALASTKDFYYCFTKRYFEFFTGISVDIEVVDWNKSSDPIIAFVKESSEKLKKTQDVGQLLQEIFKSPFYRGENE